MVANSLQRFDIVRATLVCVLGNQVSLSRFHYLVGIITGSVTDQDFAASWESAVAPSLLAVLDTHADYRGATAQINRPNAGQYSLFPPGRSTALSAFGGVAGAPMPGQVRGLVTFKGSLALRGLNCRTYVPFPGVGAQSPLIDQPNATYQLNIGTYGSAIVNFISASGGGGAAQVALVDWSTKIGVREVLTTSLVSAKWATQRRSGNYGRPNTVPF